MGAKGVGGCGRAGNVCERRRGRGREGGEKEEGWGGARVRVCACYRERERVRERARERELEREGGREGERERERAREAEGERQRERGRGRETVSMHFCARVRACAFHTVCVRAHTQEEGAANWVAKAVSKHRKRNRHGHQTQKHREVSTDRKRAPVSEHRNTEGGQ